MSQHSPAERTAGPATDGALERFTRRLAAAADDPAVAAREGLLGLADRADAAERADLAGRSNATAAASARPAPLVPDALDDALRRLLEPTPVTAPSAPAAAPAATADAVQLSTSRPEFTALLDQLLAPARAGDPAAAVAGLPTPRGPEPAAPAPAPVAEQSGAGLSPSGWPASTPVPPAYREASLPPAPVTPTPPPAPPAPPAPPVQHAVARHTLGRTTGPGEGVQNRDRREDPQLAADRQALRALGVPTAWTRQLRPGDRFTAVLRMLERMPEVDIDPGTRVVAVVGPAASVLLEAHRTALDLPTTSSPTAGPAPRPVVHVPAAAGADRAAALAEARLIGDVVVAVEATADVAGAAQAVEALQAIGAGAVIALVSADALDRAQALLDALGQVDALAVEGTDRTSEPAGVLQLGLPVVRLDGIPVDRYTWTAVLLAQLGPAQQQ